MFYLLLCAILNVGILLCFSLFKRYNLNTFQAIVFNYVTCVFTGMAFIHEPSSIQHIKLGANWVWIGLGLGVIFITTFYLMALTTQRFSITVSSIAAKMSLVIPVLVSLFILNVESKDYSLFNYIGIFIAFPAIIMSSIKKGARTSKSCRNSALLLPLIVFIFGGVIDSAINYTNHKYLSNETEAVFPIIVFSSAALLGIFAMIFQKMKLKVKNIIGGLFLGIINYFSIYFLIKALSDFNNDGAILYPLLNVVIIAFSALVSVALFKERLSKVNIIGLFLALGALFLISYQELTSLFI